SKRLKLKGDAVPAILDPTAMPQHTNVRNCFHYVITFALSLLTARLRYTEYLCVSNLNHSSVHLLEKYVGSDELGIRNAEHYNNQSWKMKQRKEELETICRANARLYIKSETRKVPPVVTVRSNSKARYGQLTTLECHAYNFYPQAINVTWLLDGSEVTGDVVSTEFMDNGDWSYQMHSYLELVLHRGVPVSCRVEHSGLKEPLVTLWGETRFQGNNKITKNVTKIKKNGVSIYTKCK
uniref:Ig-like domain-containing protein n=1 Tax=Sinocyclocheilus anshuiensis TaxID=1608454 RepID=A0A671QMJ5_9TELE